MQASTMNRVRSSDESLPDPSPAICEPALELPWQERRDQFRARFEQQPPAGMDCDEVDAHFGAMPAHYWQRVNWDDLTWGLKTIHGFLSLVAAPNAPATTPFMDWRHVGQSGQTRIMLCTWDRHGLLAKAAGVFSAVHLNILEADVFTRADNVVLDVFRVADSERRGVEASPARLSEMSFLLEGALSQPPRFASVWACLRHKYLAAPAPFAHSISLDNDCSSGSTVLRVQAADRLGLLYDILQAIADNRLNITQARIET